MKKVLSLLFGLFSLLAFMLPNLVEARSYRSSPSDVHVRGYTRKDGTYVSPHYRSAPDGVVSNNYSCIDDGKCGTGSSYSGSSASGNSGGSSGVAAQPSSGSSYTAPVPLRLCPENAGWNGTACACFNGYTKSRTSSACVTTNMWCMEKYGGQSYFNNTENICYCSDGYFYDKTSDTCMDARLFCSRLGLAQYDSVKNMCVCNAGTTYDEGLKKCVLPIKVEEPPAPPAPSAEEKMACPEHSTLNSVEDLCFCDTGWRLNASKDGCQKDVFVGYPKTRTDLLKCIAVGDMKKKVYYSQGHKTIKTLAIGQKYCFDDENLAKKSGYKKVK